MATNTRTTTTMFLNIRQHAHPWEHPAVEAVLAALQRKFPGDPAMVVETLKGAQFGSYRITTSSTIEDDATLAVPISGRVHHLPLELPSQSGQGSPSKEGTLLTFSNCTQGAMQAIPNSLFDEVLKEHGEVIKMCELQRHKGTSVLNGNRYLVIQPRGTIPNVIQIPDPKSRTGRLFNVYVRYKGQEYHCNVCNALHNTACPAKRAFYEAKARRETMVINKMIVSDSTLRHADGTGLCADIICMSGGRIGQVAHALVDEPSMPSKEEIIVMAGANDITKDDESVDVFTTLASTAVTKLATTVKMMEKPPQPTILAPLIPQHSWRFPLREQKAIVYADMLQAMAQDEELPFHYLKRPLPVEMEDIHPTVGGTQNVLQDIDKHTSIIWNNAFITTTKAYQGVSSVYRYGCLTCDNYLHVTDGYCVACQQPSEAPGNSTPENNIVLDELMQQERDKRLLDDSETFDGLNAKHSRPDGAN